MGLIMQKKKHDEHLRRITESRFDEDAEEGVIGSLIRDQCNWPDALSKALKILEPRMFSKDRNRRFFEIICSSDDCLDEKGIELALTSGEKKLYPDALQALMGITERVETPNHVVTFAEQVRDAYNRRVFDRFNREFDDKDATGEIPFNELLADLAEKIASIIRKTGNRSVRHIGEIVEDVLQHQLSMQNGENAFPAMGFPKLDEIVTGMRPGELIIIAARPSVGKTALALQIAMNVARDEGIPVMFFSMEMTDRELGSRVLISETQIPVRYGSSYSTEEKANLDASAKKFVEIPLTIDDSSKLTVNDIRMKAKLRSDPPELIVVDYVQLLKGRGESKFEQQELLLPELKNLAQELRIPLICLSQINREGASDPGLQNLKYGGEEAADVIIILQRLNEKERESSPTEKIGVKVLKNRNGTQGNCGLVFERGKMRFR
jgi:replicative DNA helicase